MDLSHLERRRKAELKLLRRLIDWLTGRKVAILDNELKGGKRRFCFSESQTEIGRPSLLGVKKKSSRPSPSLWTVTAGRFNGPRGA